MSASVPPLRAAIFLETREGDPSFPCVLVDPDLGQRLKLDPRGMQVAELLSTERTMDELCTELGADSDTVNRAVGIFEKMHLLDTALARDFVTEAESGRQWQTSHPDTVPLLIRDDASFSCTMCGSCCGGHNVGPVAVDIVEGLRDVQQELMEKTGSKKGLFFKVPVVRGQSVEEQLVCHSHGGSCVFLSSERSCIIHRDYGAEKKPRVCRLFPYQFIATPKGISVSLQMECRGFSDARQGTPLRDQEAELRKLLSIVPELRRVRPVIMLDGLSPITYDRYEELEESLHAILDGHRDNPINSLLAMQDCIESARERPSDNESLELTELKSAVDTFTATVSAMCDALVEQFQNSDEQGVVHTETVDELKTAMGVLRANWGRVVQPLDRAEHRQLFRDVMHHHLMGKELTISRTIVLGSARMAFSWLVGKALMIARARQVKRRHLVLQDIMDAVVVMNFLLRNQGFLQAFQQLDAPVIELFHNRLPELVAAGKALEDSDKRVEFYKF